MRRYLALVSSLLTGLVVATIVAWAAAPGVINSYDAVCSPDFATRCLKPNADGSINTTPAAADQPISIDQTTSGITNGIAVAPTSVSTAGIAAIVSTVAETNHIFKSSPGNLYGFSATIGSTSGYVMLFDAIQLPANGAVTPKKCYPVTSNGTNGLVSASWQPGPPEIFATGITIGFSTTGCFTLTASTALYFSGDVQ